MGAVLSSLLEELEEKKKVASGSGSPNGARDGQAAATPTSAVSDTEKKQSQSSSSPLPPPPSTPPMSGPYKFSEIVGASAEQERQLREQVSQGQGIYLDGKKKKYWVDKNTSANCFMLFARGLSITWGSDTRYWSWRKIKQDEMSEAYTQEADIEVAYLKDVCWLEIRGSLDIYHLTPGYTYDVVFVAKLAQGAYGWSVPVDLQMMAPSGFVIKPRNKKDDIWRMEGKEGWTDLIVGEVQVPAPAPPPVPDGQPRNVDVAMLRLGGDWKRGLTLLGIKINNPKSNK